MAASTGIQLIAVDDEGKEVINVNENCKTSIKQSDFEKLVHEVKVCRNELKNLRENVLNLKRIYQKEVKMTKSLIKNSDTPAIENLQNSSYHNQQFIIDEKLESLVQPIGYIESLFKAKNGIPHQSNICSLSRSKLKIEKSVFNNPQHSLIGLEQYSHIWIIFIFHKNRQDGQTKGITKAKIQPPRLNGKTMGVFATRSPHRPNPIGLTLTCLEKIEGRTLYLSGVDLLDGTPVIDIKPYIPEYDMPKISSVEDIPEIIMLKNSQHKCHAACNEKESEPCPVNNPLENNKIDKKYSQLAINNNREFISDCAERSQHQSLSPPSELSSEIPSVSIASWIMQPVLSKLVVVFSRRAETDIRKFHRKGIHEEECMFCLEFLHGPEECTQIIIQLLQTDPRSVYRRKKCCDKLYYFTVDKLHVTTWFDDSENVTEVLRVAPLECKIQCVNKKSCN